MSNSSQTKVEYELHAMTHGGCTIEWTIGADRFIAREESPQAHQRHTQQLADWYNESHNQGMMGHENDLTARDVAEGADTLRREGGRYFLLFLNNGTEE